MSAYLPALNLAGATVGQQFSIDLGAYVIGQALDARPDDYGTLRLQNESGCGFQLQISGGDSFPIAAGQWVDYALKAHDRIVTLTVLYLLSNAPVSQLLQTYFYPGEPVPPIGVLGNSPIGLSNGVAVNQVINDGNGAVTTVLEANPSTGPNAGISSVKVNNDGSGYLGGGKTTFDNAGNIKLGSNDQLQVPVDTTSANQTPVRMGPDAHSLADWMFIIDNAGDLLMWDNHNARNVLIATLAQLLHVPGTLQVDGGITSLGSQTSAGAFGAPVIVAQVKQLLVTVTTLQTVLSFTPSAAGLYQVQLHISFGNGTAEKITAKCSYFDPNLGNPSFTFMAAGTPGVLLDGSADTIGSNVSVATIPMTIYAGTGGPIAITYQDPGGTPSDHVNAAIFRLS